MCDTCGPQKDYGLYGPSVSFVFASLEGVDGVEINYRSRYGQQGRIEAVQDTAMTGEHTSAVLDIQLALEQTFDQGSPLPL